MKQEQKQVLNIMNCKSFNRSEANENERRWDENKIDRLNNDPANNYDKTRMHLNFEIGNDGKIHPLGFREKRLDERLKERLDELGYHPFKADSKIQPNICATMIIGGSHERTTEMAFGNQIVNHKKEWTTATCTDVGKWRIGQWMLFVGAVPNSARKMLSVSKYILTKSPLIAMPLSFP